MLDATQWDKDAKQLRQALTEAYRAGDGDAIANGARALLALLRRADRPRRADGPA